MIIDNKDRNKLAEGRNYGFGFSILNKINENDYETLMPFTACKDYLNDFVYVESTKNKLELIYGFKHNYIGVLEDKSHFYLGVKSLNYNKGVKKWDKYDSLNELLNNNHINLIKFINKIEKYFNLEDLTTLETLIDNTIILKVPIFWSKFTFLISLYTLYIRCFMNITDEELDKDIKDIISKNRITYLEEDRMLYLSTIKWIEYEYFDKLLDFKYKENITSSYIHNFGIGGRVNEITKLLKLV